MLAGGGQQAAAGSSGPWPGVTGPPPWPGWPCAAALPWPELRTFCTCGPARQLAGAEQAALASTEQ